MICPHCKKQLQVNVNITPPKSGWRKQTTMQSAAPSITAADGPADYAHYERKEPYRPANFESDIIVPLTSSFIWSTLLAIPTAGLPIFYGYLGWPWYTPLAAWAIMTPAAWAINSIDFHKSLWIIESAIGRDIDNDGIVGKPEQVEITLTVNHQNHEGHTRTTRQTLPSGIQYDNFINWCHQVGNGLKTPGESNWVGKNKPFDKTAYRDLLKMMEQNGILFKDGSARNAPWKISRRGRRALLYYVETAKNSPLGQTDGQTDGLDQGNYHHI